MAGTDDRRVRRTRAALERALIELMVEKGYDALTVQDLIDRADIGRSTFYTHFTDKSDLLGHTLGGLRAMLEVVSGAPPPDRRRPLRFSRELFEHVHEQKELVRALMLQSGGGSVVGGIEALLLEVVTGELEAFAAGQRADRAVPPLVRVPLDLVARSVVATTISTLRWWVGEGFEHTPEELERMFQALTAPTVRAAIPPPPTAVIA